MKTHKELPKKNNTEKKIQNKKKVILLHIKIHFCRTLIIKKKSMKIILLSSLVIYSILSVPVCRALLYLEFSPITKVNV